MTEWNVLSVIRLFYNRQTKANDFNSKKPHQSLAESFKWKTCTSCFLCTLFIIYRGLIAGERERLCRTVRPCFNENPRFVIVFLLGASIFSLQTDGSCNERQRTEFVCKWCLSLEKMGKRLVCQLLAAPPPAPPSLARHYLHAPSLLLNVRSLLAAS